MKNTLDIRAAHKQYEELLSHDQLAVDVAFKEIQNTFKTFGLACATDDRAEELIAAITQYLLDSTN